jgi:hypothetical protein
MASASGDYLAFTANKILPFFATADVSRPAIAQ